MVTIQQSDLESIREEGVNIFLAQQLRKHGLSAKAERRTRRGIPDIRIELKSGDLVILECKWEGSRRSLNEQLKERLEGFPEALGTIGILYPSRLRYAESPQAELETAKDIQWWLFASHGTASPHLKVRKGSVADLADHLRTLPLELEGRDRVAAAAATVGYAIEQSAKKVSQHARLSRRISDIIARTDQEKNRAAALRIGCLVLFNALAFQSRLAAINDDVPTVSEALRKGIIGLLDAWRSVCDNIDYVPVFKLAIDILDALGDGPDEVQNPVVDPLFKAVKETRRLEGHDLTGRLFHTLLTDAKFTGAYYTSVAAATLLSRLVFHRWPHNVDWKDHEFPAALNVADIACGTGTLLMAVASEAERRHKEANGNHAAELHKAMVEQALHGYDVQLSAVHFAAASLAMLNPDIQFDRMNLYVMPLGAEGTNVSLGSLDFLGMGEATVQFALSDQYLGITTKDAKRVSGGGLRGVEEEVTATLPSLDLAIMNPPFTRSVGGNLLFGSLPSGERAKLRKELSQRLKSKGASGTAGLGAAFVAAVSPKLRPKEGRLALVLPVTVCTGQSWRQTRSLVEQQFTLDMVITSHDPLRWNFSDSTDLSEALLIATRRSINDQATELRTTFVNLWRNPDGLLDAHRMAESITATAPVALEANGTALLEVDGSHVGEVMSLPKSKIANRQWFGVQFARADLVRSALKLLHDGTVWIPSLEDIASVPLSRFGEMGKMGPDVRDVRDGFDPTDAVTAYPMVENHDTEQRKQLTAKSNKYLAPLSKSRPGRHLKPLTQLWARSGRLLVAERARLNTARVVSMWSDKRVLSNVWWPVRMEDVSTEKAIAIWLNSSLGLLSLLAVRNTTLGSWVKFKKADLEALPVLDPSRLSNLQLRDLQDLFDRLAEVDFERLPHMARCASRQSLDNSLSDILGLPNLSKLRELLATEPVVSNRRL